MKQYYIHNGQSEIGPLNQDELKAHQLNKNTPVWYEGLENWTTAGNIDSLRSYFQSTPPPFNATNPHHNNSHSYTPPPPYFKETDYNKEERSFFLKYKNWIFLASGILILFLGYLILRDIRSRQLYNSQEAAINSVAEREKLRLKAEERQRIHALTLKNRGIRNNWHKYFTTTTNSYTYNTLGGIKNLIVKVQNDTEYHVNGVQVAVRYIKSNGGLYKTEYVLVSNIPPYSEGIAYAPDSDRGTSVDLEINSIYAKSFKFCYEQTSGGNGNHNDPWRCRGN
jgi:hypothetical protein